MSAEPFDFNLLLFEVFKLDYFCHYRKQLIYYPRYVKFSVDFMGQLAYKNMQNNALFSVFCPLTSKTTVTNDRIRRLFIQCFAIL